MDQANVEPVIIEDLVRFGEDRGQIKGTRHALRRMLAVRKLTLGAEGEVQIDSCDDLETLRRWFDQAVLAESAADVLA